jgi:hypothetical protein
MAENGRRKRDDALALAAGQTLRNAAAAASIGERTATCGWADPLFRQRVAQLRADMVGRALGKLADGMTPGCRRAGVADPHGWPRPAVASSGRHRNRWTAKFPWPTTGYFGRL